MYVQGLRAGNEVLLAGGFEVLSFSPLDLHFFDVVEVYHQAT